MLVHIELLTEDTRGPSKSVMRGYVFFSRLLCNWPVEESVMCFNNILFGRVSVGFYSVSSATKYLL